jgi:TolA-binding protein
VITRLFFTAALLVVGVAHAQVTCQTYGNTTNCNGSLGGATVAPQPFVNYGDAAQSYAQAALAQQQAQLARAQADAIRQQTYALQQQQQIEAQREQQREQQVTEEQSGKQYDLVMGCVRRSPGAMTSEEAVAISDRCKRDPTSNPPQGASMSGSTAPDVSKLKADAATFEAIMRSAPPSSKTFRDAVQSLQATNEELARRGALK